MKNLITVIVCIVTLLIVASCGKQAGKSSAKKMNGVEFTKKYGIVLPSLDYTDGQLARGKKAKADAVLLSVFTDLTLTESGGVLTTTLSPDAEWGGVQKWVVVDTTNNAVSLCNWNWSYTAAPTTITCNGAVSGFQYRSWTSDKVTYDVHLSAFLPLP